MSKYHFSDEEVEILRGNPYTLSVTEASLILTAAYKEMFWFRYKSGEKPADIFKSCGYDPEMLGKQRIQNFVYLIRKAKINGREFTDHPHARPRCSRKAAEPETIDARTVAAMQHEIVYLRQELEALKKISSLGTRKKR